MTYVPPLPLAVADPIAETGTAWSAMQIPFMQSDPNHIERQLDETRPEASEARRRLLDVAEQLFMERGYSAISLRDIADALHIRQASLYYHFPGGKEEIYLAVVDRAFARHRDGVEAAIRSQHQIEAQLQAVVEWFDTQPRMCLMGMVHADLPALHVESARSVTAAAYRGLLLPLSAAFAEAQKAGEVRACNPQMLAGTFLALLDGITIAQGMPNAGSRKAIAQSLISILLDGVRQHVPSTGA